MQVKRKSEIEIFVSRKVKEKREQAGKSQAELADELNLSYGFIGQAESVNHRVAFNLDHINKLAEVFNCSPKDFLPERYFSVSNDTTVQTVLI